MQYPFSIITPSFESIEATLSPARLGRYLYASNNDKQLALRLYVWNARLCEAVYLPLQFAEVASRNAISLPVRRRFGETWYNNEKFINLLPTRQKELLASTVKKELGRRKASLSQDHLVAGLPFGFWVALMTKAYQNQLWVNGMRQSFPNCNTDDCRSNIYEKLDKLRNFRNDVAHHYAIFDRGVQSEFQNAMYIIKMVCNETHWLANEVSKVSQTINQRPKF